MKRIALGLLAFSLMSGQALAWPAPTATEAFHLQDRGGSIPPLPEGFTLDAPQPHASSDPWAQFPIVRGAQSQAAGGPWELYQKQAAAAPPAMGTRQWLTTIDGDRGGVALFLGVIVFIMVIVKHSFQAIKTQDGKQLFGGIGQVIKVSWNLLTGAVYLLFVVSCWIANPILGIIVTPLPLLRRKRHA